MNDFDDDDQVVKISNPPAKVPPGPAPQIVGQQKNIFYPVISPGVDPKAKNSPQINPAIPPINHLASGTQKKADINPFPSSPFVQNQKNPQGIPFPMQDILSQGNKRFSAGLEHPKGQPLFPGQINQPNHNFLQPSDNANRVSTPAQFPKLEKNSDFSHKSPNAPLNPQSLLVNQPIMKLNPPSASVNPPSVSVPQEKQPSNFSANPTPPASVQPKPELVQQLAPNQQFLKQPSPVIAAKPAVIQEKVPVVNANVLHPNNLKFENKPSVALSDMSKKNYVEQNYGVLGKVKDDSLYLKEKGKFGELCKQMIMIMQESVVCSKVMRFNKLFAFLDARKNDEDLEELICIDCEKLYLRMELKCKHSICICCFCERIQEFLKKPDLGEIEKIRCEDCRTFFSIEDVECLFGKGSNQSTRFSQLNIEKKCIWCKREQNLLKSYSSELECLHLCSQCYLTQVYYRSVSCFGCGVHFNLDFTFNRESTCMKCKYTGGTVLEGFRSLHEDHELCYVCINKALTENRKFDVCPVCNKSLSKSDEAVLASFFNKNCLYCSQSKPISELIICRNCPHIICDTCTSKGLNTHQCLS